MQPLALQVHDAVRVSGLGRSSLYEAIRNGRLPIRKAGRRTLILADDLKRFVESLPSAKPSKTA
jgi:excisionase family DNA binding protein